MITILLFTLFALVLVFNIERAYTAVDMIFAIVTLALVTKFNPKLLNSFYLTFLFMLIPFFIVNGILTGSFIPEPVVWYNNSENLGIRLFTIPIEDAGYAFTMLFWIVFLNEQFKKMNLFKTV